MKRVAASASEKLYCRKELTPATSGIRTTSGGPKNAGLTGRSSGLSLSLGDLRSSVPSRTILRGSFHGKAARSCGLTLPLLRHVKRPTRYVYSPALARIRLLALTCLLLMGKEATAQLRSGPATEGESLARPEVFSERLLVLLDDVLAGRAPNAGRFCGYCYHPLAPERDVCPHCGRSTTEWAPADAVPRAVFAMHRRRRGREGLVVRDDRLGRAHNWRYRCTAAVRLRRRHLVERARLLRAAVRLLRPVREPGEQRRRRARLPMGTGDRPARMGEVHGRAGRSARQVLTNSRDVAAYRIIDALRVRVREQSVAVSTAASLNSSMVAIRAR